MTTLDSIDWGWWGMDLGRARPVRYTYEFFPYTSLPPLPRLDGSLKWLSPEDDPVAPLAKQACDDQEQPALATIAMEAHHLSLALPPAFVRLMGSRTLRERIPEYAGSWFPPLTHIVPGLGTDGWLIRFMSDQQDVVVWFLYLTPQGEEVVMGSSEGNIDATVWDEEQDGTNVTAEDLAEVLANTAICAPSFEQFIYRFWLETSLYNKLHGFDEAALTPEEQRYLAWYEERETVPLK